MRIATAILGFQAIEGVLSFCLIIETQREETQCIVIGLCRINIRETRVDAVQENVLLIFGPKAEYRFEKLSFSGR
jgi:hypothetical protein